MPESRALTKGHKGTAMCLYGVAGAGKTRFIGTGPRTLIMRPPTDHTESIVLPADVEEVVVTGHADLLDTFVQIQQGAYKELDWVWLDSATLFEEVGLDDVFAEAVARKPQRAEFGPDKGEYGINRGRLSKHIRDMVGLANDGLINYGITAHPMDWYDPVQEKNVWVPMIGSVAKGDLSAKICGYMHIVAYLAVVKKDGEQRRVLTTASDGFVGKDQIGAFGESGKIVDPTMDKLIQGIRGARPHGARNGRTRSATKKPRAAKRVARR